MKKVLTAALVFALASLTLSAKPKKMELTLDFTGGNPLVATQAGETPDRPSFKTPITGRELPTVDYKKDVDAALENGYLPKDKEKDGEVTRGYYLPHTAFSFTSGGKEYPITISTAATPGRFAYCYYNAKLACLRIYKGHFSVPSVDGYVLTGFQAYVKPPKKGGDNFTFRVYKNNDRKTLIGQTNSDNGESEILETRVEGVQPGDAVRIFSYNIHMVQKFVFTYSPVAKSKKKK